MTRSWVAYGCPPHELLPLPSMARLFFPPTTYWRPPRGRWPARATTTYKPTRTERDARRIAREAVSSAPNETTVIGRRSVYDDLDVSSQGRTGVDRSSPAISERASWDYESPRLFPGPRSIDRAKPTGADRRQYHPNGKYAWPSTVYGTDALTIAQTYTGLRSAVKFVSPTKTAPCVQRYVRRRVIFAKKQNRGHHKKKHRNYLSAIGC